VMVLVGVLFWAIGRAGRRRGLTGEVESHPQAAAPADPAPGGH
jgi:hypothetical protein